MTVELSFERGVARMALARAPRHNAFDGTLKDAFAAAVRAIVARGAEVRGVLLSGRGPSFSAGADLKALRGSTAEEAYRFMVEAAGACRRLEQLPVPVVAAAHGHCLGGGLEILLHCDIVIAAESAVFGFPEVSLGLVTTAGSVSRLKARIGAARARWMLLTGRRISAHDALSWGLVAQVVPDDELETRAQEIAESIARMPAHGFAAMKSLVLRCDAAENSASFLAELEAFTTLVDLREGGRLGAPIKKPGAATGGEPADDGS
jgi:enoyl-CoA hydratase/carnithine racemase